MTFKRNWLNLTVMADGQVLANGGTANGTDGGAANSAYQVEIWDPATGQWRRGARAARIRTYHSTSVLMQSGAVFTGGGGVPGPEDNLNAELYVPVPGSGNDKTLRLFGFMDAGNVWYESEKMQLDDLRVSAGIGLSWISPVGPLKLSVGTPVRKQPADRIQRFQFQIGTAF